MQGQSRAASFDNGSAVSIEFSTCLQTCNLENFRTSEFWSKAPKLPWMENINVD